MLLSKVRTASSQTPFFLVAGAFAIRPALPGRRIEAEEESVRTAFVVTDDDSAFQMVCRDLPSAVLPVRLYESYLQNFQLRGGR